MVVLGSARGLGGSKWLLRARFSAPKEARREAKWNRMYERYPVFSTSLRAPARFLELSIGRGTSGTRDRQQCPGLPDELGRWQSGRTTFSRSASSIEPLGELGAGVDSGVWSSCPKAADFRPSEGAMGVP